MRIRKTFPALLLALVLLAPAVWAQQSEQDVIDRYLGQTEKRHTKKLGFALINFTFNRVNRANDYNRFAIYVSDHIQNGTLNWLKSTYSFGAEAGTIVMKRLALSVGGEYWLKAGQTLSGTYTYNPPGGTAQQLTDPSSEIQVYGLYGGVHYYIFNPPDPADKLKNLAVRLGGTAGYYIATWDLWSQYENLNLTTSLSEGQNISYKGYGPGFSVNVGAEYPLGWWGLAAALDIHYLHLNLGNVAWYNAQDEEIVASYTGDVDGRVDLGLSGFRAKLELKRFFSW
jgi:hypothetical protein